MRRDGLDFPLPVHISTLSSIPTPFLPGSNPYQADRTLPLCAFPQPNQPPSSRPLTPIIHPESPTPNLLLSPPEPTSREQRLSSSIPLLSHHTSPRILLPGGLGRRVHGCLRTLQLRERFPLFLSRRLQPVATTFAFHNISRFFSFRLSPSGQAHWTTWNVLSTSMRCLHFVAWK